MKYNENSIKFSGKSYTTIDIQGKRVIELRNPLFSYPRPMVFEEQVGATK